MRASGRRSICIAATATVALMGVGTPAGAKERLDSFAGACSVKGMVGFSPPATNAQQSLSTWYDATGSCNGELNGKQVSNAPVRLRSAVHGVDGSCMHADTTRPGRGALTFADGTTIAYTFHFKYVLTEGTWSVSGQRSGSAVGHGSFVTDRTPPGVSQECAGKGVREIPMDVQFATDSPLVSSTHGSRGDRPSKRNEAQGGAERLRLSVRPRSVRAGRRTAFTFRVVTPRGRPASRAVVRFAGRRLRAGRRGRMRIVTTFQRPGRRAVRASKRGCRAVRATIRVRRR